MEYIKTKRNRICVFEEEKNRLLNIKDRETGKTAVYTEEDFFDPGVYAMNNHEGCYEYVLFFEKELKMVYVYLQGCVDRRDLFFSLCWCGIW